MFGGPQVVVTTNGTVLSLMEGRKHNNTIDLVDDGGWHDVLLKRSFTSGESWSPMQIVHSESNSTHNVTIGNHAAVVDQRNGRVHLFMNRNNTWVLNTYSDSHGAAWAPVRDVTASVKAPGWGWIATSFSGIQVQRGRYAGRLIISADHRIGQWSASPKRRTHSHAIISDSGGRNWRSGEGAYIELAPDEGFGGTGGNNQTNECTIAERADGSLIMNSRNYVGAAFANVRCETFSICRAVSLTLKMNRHRAHS